MKFNERLERYKKEADYFIVDVYKGGEDPYESIHDLTWQQAKMMFGKFKKNESVSRVDIIVEDWDKDENDEDFEDWLFYEVESLVKKPFKWSLGEYLSGESSDMYGHPIGWRVEE